VLSVCQTISISSRGAMISGVPSPSRSAIAGDASQPSCQRSKSVYASAGAATVAEPPPLAASQLGVGSGSGGASGPPSPPPPPQAASITVQTRRRMARSYSFRAAVAPEATRAQTLHGRAQARCLQFVGVKEVTCRTVS
jgi:hypothetical protein